MLARRGISEAALCLECRLVQQGELPSNNLYIGEIVGAWSEDEYMTEGRLDLKKMDVFFLSMPDNQYWSLGDVIGRAWDRGNLAVGDAPAW